MLRKIFNERNGYLSLAHHKSWTCPLDTLDRVDTRFISESSYYDSQVALTAIIPERHESGYDDFGESVINL